MERPGLVVVVVNDESVATMGLLLPPAAYEVPGGNSDNEDGSYSAHDSSNNGANVGGLVGRGSV